MLKSYFRTAWRNLLRDRQFSLLNLIGLSIGLACSLLIYLWVADELRVDKFHKNDKRIYQVMAHIHLPDGIHTFESTPFMLAREIAKEIPEVQSAVSFQPGFIDGIVSTGEHHIKAKRFFTDKDFFNIFSFHLIEGDRNRMFENKYGLLISQRLAMKLFNTTKNLIGKPLHWGDDKDPYAIAGIYENPPSNSSLQFDLLSPYQLYFDANLPDASDWQNCNPFTFLLLKENADAKQLNERLTSFLQLKSGNKSPLTLTVRKYSDKYLYDLYENGVQAGGRIQYVKLFSIVACLILTIACFNFMNLSTAKAASRMKEVGVKKVLGAGRRSLIFQFMSESILLAYLSLIISLGFVLLLLPQFNHVTGKDLSLHANSGLLIILVFIGLFTGLFAGSYPAFYISGFKPALILKGKLQTVWGELWIRKGLVVCQYTISVLLILGVLVINKQMHLIQTVNLGYNKNNIISFSNERRINDHFAAFMSDLKKIPGVVGASAVEGDLNGNASGSTEHLEWEGKSPTQSILFTDIDVDLGFMEMLNIKMAEGRTFSSRFASDSLGIIFNQSAVDAMGLKDPLGKRIKVWGAEYHIIGIAKNFHFESLYEKVKPCFIRWLPAGSKILAKINGKRTSEAIAGVGRLYQQYNMGIPFEFRFMDEDYQAMYASEKKVASLFRYFAALAIIISGLGLFGLSAFSAQKRQKEIGIRKVVGASAFHITMMLSKDFVRLVCVAVLIGFPLAWWAIASWLNSFAYRVHIGISIFLITFAALLIITLSTISFQSIKAALANPVNSLRSE
ncbi:MAG: ABC transporter permease [Chitinophagales bacterium]